MAPLLALLQEGAAAPTTSPTSAAPNLLSGTLVPLLLVLSALKFVLVVLFYMHLKFDNRFFAFLFSGPLLLAIGVMIGLLFLFFGAVRLRTGT